jgi:hypothetical protein
MSEERRAKLRPDDSLKPRANNFAGKPRYKQGSSCTYSLILCLFNYLQL